MMPCVKSGNQENRENRIILNMNTFIKHQLSYRELTLNLHDTAPLLGYTDDLPDDILAIVEEVLNETAGCFDICGGYQIFDRIDFVKEGHQLRIADVDFSPHKIVYHQLKNSEQLAVFVCTAGEGISQWSKQTMSDDPLKGFIADILGSVVVEASIEKIQQMLSDEMAQAGLKITNRYSPGYCGWPTVEQHKLFSLLPEGNCGVRLTESALMLPIKSVSGVIGIGANVGFHPYTCQLCDAAFCVYRNRKMR
jgi:hypothetical protein